MEIIVSLKELCRYIGYKLRQKFLLITLLICIVPIQLILLFPLEFRYVYLIILFSFGFIPIYYTTNLIFYSFIQLIYTNFYSLKYKPQKIYIPKLKQIAEKMGLKNYNKPVLVTDNPKIESPYINPFSGLITLPSNFQKRFKLHNTELYATLAHELGHLKTRRKFLIEFSITFLVIIILTFLIGIINPIAVVFAESAIIMLLIPKIMRNNEYRADELGAKATSPEALIATFESLKSNYKNDEGSDTHPPLQERINRLMKLLDDE